MKLYLFILLLIAPIVIQAQGIEASRLRKTTFANLGTPSGSNIRDCTDCGIAANGTCASGGTGATATRRNGAWYCSTGGTAGAAGTVTNVTGTAPIAVATGTTTPVVSCATCLASGGALGTPSSGTLTNVTGLPEGGLSLTDITTNDFSITKHGFVPKGTNVGSFLRDDGTWATVGAPAFSSISTGTNNTATMTVGTGASITTSGSGTNQANQLIGAAWIQAGSKDRFYFDSGTNFFKSGTATANSDLFVFRSSNDAIAPFALHTGQGVFGSGVAVGFASTSSAEGATLDTAYSKCSANVHCFGNGTQGDFSGTVKTTTINSVTNYQINGVTIYSGGTPSIAGNATLNTGSKDSAGKVTATGTGASTIVLTFSITFTRAPACFVTNETTSNLVRPVSTTTTLTFNATIVTGDSLSYQCTGY